MLLFLVCFGFRCLLVGNIGLKKVKIINFGRFRPMRREALRERQQEEAKRKSIKNPKEL